MIKTPAKGHARIGGNADAERLSSRGDYTEYRCPTCGNYRISGTQEVGLRTALMIRRRAGSQSIAAAGDGLCPELPGIPARGNRSDGWTMATIEIEDRWEEKWAAKR